MVPSLSTIMETRMTIAETLLPEFDLEMAATRAVIARVPEAKFGWKPHEKSFAMGALAQHLATIPYYGTVALERDGFDVSAAERRAQLPTTREILDLFDRNAGEARARLAAARDEDFSRPWTLKSGPHTVFTLPKAAVLRRMMMSHMIHHRGQMTVYLRLNEIAVPGTFGPTADEPM